MNCFFITITAEDGTVLDVAEVSRGEASDFYLQEKGPTIDTLERYLLGEWVSAELAKVRDKHN